MTLLMVYNGAQQHYHLVQVKNNIAVGVTKNGCLSLWVYLRVLNWLTNMQIWHRKQSVHEWHQKYHSILFHFYQRDPPTFSPVYKV